MLKDLHLQLYKFPVTPELEHRDHGGILDDREQEVDAGDVNEWKCRLWGEETSQMKHGHQDHAN